MGVKHDTLGRDNVNTDIQQKSTHFVANVTEKKKYPLLKELPLHTPRKMKSKIPTVSKSYFQSV